MSTVPEILDEIRALPPEGRWKVLEQTRGLLESEIPESFREGMAAIARGETLDLEEVMKDLQAEFERPE